MVRIINGVVFEDGKPGKRVINTNGGNYVEKIEGDFIAGTVINQHQHQHQHQHARICRKTVMMQLT
ncbi:hypothetical protein [Microcoleus sp. D3_18a_C4]|uniref:hypothetical protein n=1 Tax=Microcoleus sp. D3_18a_C4 TaxID=3055332 RepID=UPI002FD6DD97